MELTQWILHRCLWLGLWFGTRWCTERSAILFSWITLEGASWICECFIDRKSVFVWKIVTPRTETLVEYRGMIKHAIHSLHRRDIPTWQVTIEFIGRLKHPRHISHRWNFPTWHVTIEHRVEGKHGPHVRHGWDIPSRQVTIECSGFVEHTMHSRHRGHVPPW